MVDLDGKVTGADSLVLLPRMLGTREPLWLPVVGLTTILQSTCESDSPHFESEGSRYLPIALLFTKLFVDDFFLYSPLSSRSAKHISDFFGNSFCDMLKSLSLTPSMCSCANNCSRFAAGI